MIAHDYGYGDTIYDGHEYCVVCDVGLGGIDAIYDDEFVNELGEVVFTLQQQDPQHPDLPALAGFLSKLAKPFRKAGRALKKVGKGVAKVVKKAAPILMVTGVGGKLAGQLFGKAFASKTVVGRMVAQGAPKFLSSKLGELSQQKNAFGELAKLQGGQIVNKITDIVTGGKTPSPILYQAQMAEIAGRLADKNLPADQKAALENQLTAYKSMVEASEAEARAAAEAEARAAAERQRVLEASREYTQQNYDLPGQAQTAPNITVNASTGSSHGGGSSQTPASQPQYVPAQDGGTARTESGFELSPTVIIVAAIVIGILIRRVVK